MNRARLYAWFKHLMPMDRTRFCAWLKRPMPIATAVTAGTACVIATILGGMMLGFHFVGPHDPTQPSLGMAIVFTAATAASCWFPIWTRTAIQDLIEKC